MYERFLQHPKALNFQISSKDIDAQRCAVLEQRQHNLRAWEGFGIIFTNLLAFEKHINI